MGLFAKKQHDTAPGTGTMNAPGHTKQGAPKWMLPIRILQFILALVLLALCAYAKNFFDELPIDPAYKYGIFTGIFVLLCCIFFMVASCVAAAHHPIAVLVLDALCLLFLTICWPLLAGYSGKYKNAPIRVIGGNNSFRNEITSYGNFAGWRAGVAATIFAVLLWLLFIVTTIFTFLHGRKNRFAKPGSHAAHNGTGMGAVGGTPAYGENMTTGTTTTSTYPVDNGMNQGMGQPGYNSTAANNMGGYSAGPTYQNPV